MFIVVLALYASVCGAVERVDLARQREQFPLVWEAAKRDPTGTWIKLAAGLESYPLYPYLGLASLQRRMPQLQRADVDEFLKAWPDSLPAKTLREAFLSELARRGDWKNFSELFDAATHSRELRCDAMQAQIASNSKLSPQTVKELQRDVEAVWLTPSALPPACDVTTRWARDNGYLNSTLVWQRIELLASKPANAAAISALAAFFPDSDRAVAEHVAAALRDPSAALAQAAAWPDTAHSRDAVVLAVERLAKRDADDAQSRWTRLSTQFHFDTNQRGRALRAIALYHASSYSADAAARLGALPNELNDDATREWSVRTALAAGDFKATLAALKLMPESQRSEPRWRYLAARMLSKLGHNTNAEKQFSTLAREPNFFGFLAADQINTAYTICAEEVTVDNAAEESLRRDPNLARAFEFFALARLSEARREWDYAQTKLTPAQRRIAIALASREGWLDRAVYALNQGDDVHLYSLRFPLGKREAVVRAAHDGGVDPAWAYAIIRAESAWTADAKSGANAYGLMQLLPGTAARVAREQKLSFGGAANLFDADLNIQLGTRYLGQMAARYDGSPWLASAAYNAGPEPVSRWVNARDSLDPDLFIETIPYKETREYVSRVLAFSVIYDWRLHGAMQTLTSRLPRIGQAYDPPGDNVKRRAPICIASEQQSRAPSATTEASTSP